MRCLPTSARHTLISFWLLSATLFSQVYADDSALASARSALEQGNPADAYAELQALELERSGDPTFDYWLGVAALRAGEPSHALIALDRAILRQPNHAGARMERVAALLQLDQRASAEHEIKRLESLSPPPEAQAAIERFQAVIHARREAETSPQHRGRLGVDIGYDSNPQRFPSEIAIDLLTAEERTTIKLFKTMNMQTDSDLSNLGIERFSRDASTYQRLQGSYQGRFPIDDESRWLVDATGQAQRYTQEAAQDFDLTLGQTQLGYQRDLEAQRVFTLRGSMLQGFSGRHQNHLLTRWGTSAELSQPVGLDSELTWQLGAQHNRFNNRSNRFDAGIASIQLHTQHTALRSRVTAQLEREWANDSRDGGNLNHLRIGGGLDLPVSDQHLLRADLNHRIRRYQDDGFAPYNGSTPTQRRDRIWQARLTWLYQLNRDWLLEASADMERRRSSVDFFDTRRQQAQLGLRYLF